MTNQDVQAALRRDDCLDRGALFAARCQLAPSQAQCTWQPGRSYTAAAAVSRRRGEERAPSLSQPRRTTKPHQLRCLHTVEASAATQRQRWAQRRQWRHAAAAAVVQRRRWRRRRRHSAAAAAAVQRRRWRRASSPPEPHRPPRRWRRRRRHSAAVSAAVQRRRWRRASSPPRLLSLSCARVPACSVACFHAAERFVPQAPNARPPPGTWSRPRLPLRAYRGWWCRSARASGPRRRWRGP